MKGFITEITATASFGSPKGRGYLDPNGQAVEVYRLGAIRPWKRVVPFRLRVLVAPVQIKWANRAGQLPKDDRSFIVAPNEADVNKVRPYEIAESEEATDHTGFRTRAFYRSLQLSDPGGVITLESGSTPGLLPVDADPGTPYYEREPLSVGDYHKILHEDFEGGHPDLRKVDEVQLPSFWMKDRHGHHYTFDPVEGKDVRVSPAPLPVALMKADEFMDSEVAYEWSQEVRHRLIEQAGLFHGDKLDIMFGYARRGEVKCRREFIPVDEVGRYGAKPQTQMITSSEQYLRGVLQPLHTQARAMVCSGNIPEISAA